MTSSALLAARRLLHAAKMPQMSLHNAVALTWAPALFWQPYILATICTCLSTLMR